jgi:hypothetical protein
MRLFPESHRPYPFPAYDSGHLTILQAYGIKLVCDVCIWNNQMVNIGVAWTTFDIDTRRVIACNAFIDATPPRALPLRAVRCGSMMRVMPTHSSLCTALEHPLALPKRRDYQVKEGGGLISMFQGNTAHPIDLLRLSIPTEHGHTKRELYARLHAGRVNTI